MAIKTKKKPTIKKGAGYVYIPDKFEEHTVPNFIEVDDPQYVVDNIVPFDFRGRKIISFDTESHPHYKKSSDVPVGVVRRWVGSGKKANPQDYPFCIQIYDGTNAFAVYDSFENGFKKFKQLATIFEDASIEKIAHNAKFDMHMFANAGLKIKGRIHDTVVLAKLANENRHSFSLVDLATKLNGGIVKFEYMLDNYKQMNKITDYRQFPRPLMNHYGCADVVNCFLEFLKDYEVLERDELIELYDDECELMIALYSMERYGMSADLSYEQQLKEELSKLTEEAETAIYEEAGRLFNINSGAQLYKVLLSLGVHTNLVAMSDKGNPVLDKNALAVLADVHGVSIVKKILDYRKYEKLLNTYAVGIYDQCDSEGKVHGSINQTEATTGRMSITKPALQTLPKKDKRVRRIFLPDGEARRLWFMDLDQVEYRLFAHYAKIPALLESIKKGYDVHAATAAILFHKEVEDVADDERSRAKTINFALIYGMGVEALAVALNMTVTEATELKARYFAQIPEARPFINTVQQVIKQRGFVKNWYGRRRRLSSDDSYKAPNALIQGCAADYIKKKIILMYKYLCWNMLYSRLENVVHDEVILDMLISEEEHAPVLRWLLSDFKTFRCPITAGVEVGAPSWGQKEVVDASKFGFKEPESFDFLLYNVYNGDVFDIGKAN